MLGLSADVAVLGLSLLMKFVVISEFSPIVVGKFSMVLGIGEVVVDKLGNCSMMVFVAVDNNLAEVVELEDRSSVVVLVEVVEESGGDVVLVFDKRNNCCSSVSALGDSSSVEGVGETAQGVEAVVEVSVSLLQSLKHLINKAISDCPPFSPITHNSPKRVTFFHPLHYGER